MQKWSLIVGIGITIVILLVSLFTGKWNIALDVAGVIGLGAWLIAAILTGSMNSGDRMRANTATETPEDRQQRMKWSTVFFLLGLPNLAAAVIIYFVYLR